MFEIQKYYQKKPKFNGVYSRNNLPKIKDGTYVINLDEVKSIVTHWITLYVNGNNGRTSYDAIYFDSFRVEHILKKIKKYIQKKNILTNIDRIQAYNSLMCDTSVFFLLTLCWGVKVCWIIQIYFLVTNW